MATMFGMYPFLMKLYADGGYQGPLFRRAVAKIMARVNVEIVKRSDHAKGFVALPKRWVVERTSADIAGYSRLMGVDEEGTLARLKAVRKALIDPTIAAHGRIVKTTGDGMLVEFASVVDATRCAIEVQRGV